MSILYEALQKAKEERQKQESSPVSETSGEFVERMKAIETLQQTRIEEYLRRRPVVTRQHFKVRNVLAVFLPVLVSVCLSLFYSNERLEAQRVLLSQIERDYSRLLKQLVIAESHFKQGRNLQGEPFMSEFRKSLPVGESGNALQSISQRVTLRDVIVQRIMKPPPFQCTGIVVDAAGNYAFVNGLIVRQNDVVDGARVVSVDKKDVLLEYKGARIRVPLPEI